MSERFMVVPVAHAEESAFGDEADGDSVFDAGAGEERRGSVPILRYSREPNKYGEFLRSERVALNARVIINEEPLC